MVDAKDEDEAWQIARNTDGGDFIPFDQGVVQSGDWEIYSVNNVEGKANARIR
jgi:hypothetical protein